MMLNVYQLIEEDWCCTVEDIHQPILFCQYRFNPFGILEYPLNMLSECSISPTPAGAALDFAVVALLKKQQRLLATESELSATINEVFQKLDNTASITKMEILVKLYSKYLESERSGGFCEKI